MSKDTMKQKKKSLRVTRECPKCRNTKGIICLPGSDTTYYFCHECDKKKEKKNG